MSKKVDFLVIGSGIAGLSFALNVASKGKVCIVTKGALKDSNTQYAQGGIAAVINKPDTYKKHIEDTLKAGNYLCDKSIVEMVVKESPERINDLINWGTKFDKTPQGKYDLNKEGGHSESRVLHYKDSTGEEIMRALIQNILNHKNIEVLEYYFALDLITQHHLGKVVTRKDKNAECYGAYVLNTKKYAIEPIIAKKVLISTGGIGNIYSSTTNPIIATGDGVAMVYRAKGDVENMEFIQFHPTSLFDPQERPSFLISEAVRGFGAILKTIDGHEFMHKYDPRGCLAPRDVVARAIDSEIKKRGDDFVYLDCRHLNIDEFIIKFPNIYKKCISKGIDIKEQMIPVIPAAHYSCGGIKVDKWGRTTIKNLYAAGECSSTGLHGSNRLASNSLLEAVVFSHRAGIDAINTIDLQSFMKNIPEWDDEGMVYTEEMILVTQSMKEIRSIMSDYVGIVRSNLRLERALRRLEILHIETERLYDRSLITPRLCELRNSINVAYLIIKMAMERKESTGLHYNIDYPPTI